ncbi:MAG: XamI family restriction endonuclease [Actinobacteria bacterium]|nr:XamI family restriction endonuclease [Actinomycetota bacterium]
MPRPPQTWTHAELEREAAHAKTLFVAERLAALKAETLLYEASIKKHSEPIGALLKATKNLTAVTGDSLKNRKQLDALRYTLAPIVSLDDLDTLTDSCFKQWVDQTTERGTKPTDAAFKTAAKFFSPRVDRSKAPWLISGAPATQPEIEAFIRTTASVRAMGDVQTARRMERSKIQEDAIRAACAAARYTPVTPPGELTNPIKQMPPGSYATKSRKLAMTNMDIAVRMKDNHGTGLLFLAIEAKVSNSSLNSRKRLNDVARKRERWDASGQLYQFRTAAVIAGVFSIPRLIEAQEAGVFIFWEHRLQDLTAFLR